VSAIAGIVRFDGRPDAKADLERMMRPLAMLGPDREFLWHDGAVALGMRQLALLPEDRFDRQPWRGRDGTLVMVANARIDNRDELADALGIEPVRRRTMADSEMLMKAYERWAAPALDRIVGEFTFAVWDARERRLFCARSQVEGPPLYFHRAPGFLAFATTANALFALPDVPLALDERRIARALALLDGDENVTFYRGISCLPPGRCLWADRDGVKVERYWRLDIAARIRLARDSDYVEAAREHFDRAVAARLRSIHPIGCQLSGGCDSAAVTATAARLLDAVPQGLTTFTAAPPEGYADPEPGQRIADESPYAAAIAARFGNVRHVVIRSDGRTPFAGLGHSRLLFGRPVQNVANQVWVERNLEAARERRIRVLLVGDFGNMTISYTGIPRLAALLGTGHWLALAHEVAALRRRGFDRRRLFDAAVGPFMPIPLWRWWLRRERRGAGELGNYSAINPALAAEVDLEAVARQCDRELSFRPFGDGRLMRRTVFETHDGGDFRTGYLAGWGVEMRDPMSDRRLVEFCLGIPEDQYLRHGETKFLYRRMFEPILPTAELVARKRGYQAADWHVGLDAARAEVAAEIERLEQSASARRTLDLPRLKRLVENWPTEGWHRTEVALKYRRMLMRGVAAGMFIRSVEGGNE